MGYEAAKLHQFEADQLSANINSLIFCVLGEYNLKWDQKLYIVCYVQYMWGTGECESV